MSAGGEPLTRMECSYNRALLGGESAASYNDLHPSIAPLQQAWISNTNTVPVMTITHV